ncbi:MAG: hypothetical protein ACXWC4_24630, partial [Telluria sp.]
MDELATAFAAGSMTQLIGAPAKRAGACRNGGDMAQCPLQTQIEHPTMTPFEPNLSTLSIAR